MCKPLKPIDTLHTCPSDPLIEKTFLIVVNVEIRLLTLTKTSFKMIY